MAQGSRRRKVHKYTLLIGWGIIYYPPKKFKKSINHLPNYTNYFSNYLCLWSRTGKKQLMTFWLNCMLSWIRHGFSVPQNDHLVNTTRMAKNCFVANQFWSKIAFCFHYLCSDLCVFKTSLNINCMNINARLSTNFFLKSSQTTLIVTYVLSKFLVSPELQPHLNIFVWTTRTMFSDFYYLLCHFVKMRSLNVELFLCVQLFD